jgi:hypothetical protein
MAYYIRDTAPKVEAIVGSAPVSGSGFDDFASASAKLNLVSCFHYSALATPDDIRRAFPRPEMEPKFLSMHVGGDETAIPGLVAEFYTHCPEWKSRYKPFRRFRRINPPGTWDQWFVRTTP